MDTDPIAQGTATPQESDTAIRRLVADQVAAWNAGDARKWSKDYAQDADFVNILGMQFQGREDNERRHAKLFASIYKGSRLEMTELKVRVLERSTAIANAVFELRGFARLPPGIRPTLGDEILRTRMHYVLVRGDDQWRIVFAQNTAVSPMN